MSAPNGRLTPERLAEIRTAVGQYAVRMTVPALGGCIADLLAELDAVTRERDEAMRALQSTYSRLNVVYRERDEARKRAFIEQQKAASG